MVKILVYGCFGLELGGKCVNKMNSAGKRRQKKTAKKGSPEKSTSPSSERQTQIIREALEIAVEHHNAGRLPEAKTFYQHILQTDPDQPIALHLLGVLSHQENNNDLAVDLITKALAIQPDFAEAHHNLGAALHGLGKLDEAVASYQMALAKKPDIAETHNNLGNAFKELGKLDEAVTSYQKALAIKPDYAEAHSNLGIALQDMGNLEEAEISCQKALAIKPDFAEAHNNLGSVLLGLGNPEEAVESFRKTLAIKPDFVAAYSNLGNALLDLGKVDEAVASCHQAPAIKPDFAEAHITLCGVLEKSNNTEALREAVAVAKRNCPGLPRLSLGEAQLLNRDGDYGAARAVLEATDGEIGNARFMGARAYLLGQLCDRLGDTEVAFNYFREGNLRYRDTPEAKRSDGNRYQEQIDVFAKRFTAEWVADWQLLESNDARPDPVFLVGFPRSGTTLLDTILRSHHAISVVEERSTVNYLGNALDQLPGGYPDSLAKLEANHLAELRQIYFEEFDKHLAPEDRSSIVIDKLPLNICLAGLIHRIFPQARFVFSLRHPCDCVLSCFMQGFRINEGMANFLDLEDAARLYDKIMDLWEQYKTVLPLDVHTVKYESLIEAFEETLTPLLDFLGVGWDDGVRDYTKTAIERGKISTPSYNQVTQPLYTRARGRWERYREQMQPVLPTLLPWAGHFGYGV